MFKELAPLVRHRAVLFTVSQVEDDRFRVNVIPKKIADGENDALTTPVSVTGTAEDLDRELSQTLLHFVSSHLELKNSLERAKAEMEEAARTARAEARKKSGSQATKKDLPATPNKPTAASEAAFPAGAAPLKAASLFDSAPQRAVTEPGDATVSSGNSQIDEEEEVLRESYSAGDVGEGDEAA